MSETSLYIPIQKNDRSIYQNSYVSLFTCLKKHWDEKIVHEKNESLEWILKLIPDNSYAIKMKHRETREEHESFFMLIASYDQSTEIFSWRD